MGPQVRVCEQARGGGVLSPPGGGAVFLFSVFLSWSRGPGRTSQKGVLARRCRLPGLPLGVCALSKARWVSEDPGVQRGRELYRLLAGFLGFPPHSAMRLVGPQKA